MQDKIYTALKNKVTGFTPISDAEWADFSSKWQMVEINKDDYLIKEGQIEHYFYFVFDGVLRAFATKDGDEICIGFSYNGDFSGAYDSFLAQTKSEFAIQALTKSTLLKINRENLFLLFDKYKSIERWGRLFNAEILIGMAKRQVEARSYSAEEKYLRLLNQSPHIFQLVPQKHLASYLGMTAETFSRLRKKKR
ncbi:MAG TPA: Crp/Fnr family transcriptional regulator [Fulvivirga sp.]|nr:Crp/Fnr family transcriptional regulator [Fulvivirga sp.]